MVKTDFERVPESLEWECPEYGCGQLQHCYIRSVAARTSSHLEMRKTYLNHPVLRGRDQTFVLFFPRETETHRFSAGLLAGPSAIIIVVVVVVIIIINISLQGFSRP